MMKLSHKTISRTLAAFSLTVAGAVFSQTGMPWPFGGMMGMGPGMMGGMGPGMMGGMGPGMMGPGMGHDSIEPGMASHYAAELKSRLRIVPAQESAWKAFEGTLQQQASTLRAMRDQLYRQPPGTDSTEWAAQRRTLLNQLQADRDARTAAVRELYAVLNAEQRAIIDRGASGVGWQAPCLAWAS